MAKNDKYACFQWIRDVRSKVNEDAEDVTQEERVAYNRAGAEKALAAMPKLSLAEARRQRQAMGGTVMTTDVQTAAIVSAGMKLLRDNLGALETEIFITKIGSNDFDYTKWREDLWEGLTPRELFDRAAKTTEKYTPPAEADVL